MKVGVVGYGYWGPKLVRNFQEISDSEMSWVVDRDPEMLSRVRTQYPAVRTTPDVGELLASDVEGVVIATPIRTHYALAKQALLAGKHVMVEKPLTASSAEASDLAHLADSLGLTLMVGHTFEYNAGIRALREIVASGEIGDVYYVDAARLNLGLFQKDINVIWDLAPHDISILLYVLQQDPLTVSARGSWSITPGIEDVAYVELRFPNDLMAHLHLSWLDPCKVRRVTVVGSKKMVVCDDVQDAEKIRIYDKGVDRRHETDQFRDFHLSYRYGGITIPHVPSQEPLRVQCEHFLQCIRTGQRPQSDGHAGQKVVRILEQADQSLRNGGMRQPVAISSALEKIAPTVPATVAGQTNGHSRDHVLVAPLGAPVGPTASLVPVGPEQSLTPVGAPSRVEAVNGH
jgi:predicted dehydrogenase